MKTQLQKMGALVVISLLLARLASAQKADALMFHPPNLTYDSFIQRHKTFNRIGCVLLAPGAALMVVGYAVGSSGNTSLLVSSTNFDAGITLMFVGGAMVLTSIPFFVSAESNARKARRVNLQLKSGTVPAPYKFNYVGLGLTVNL